MPFPLDTERLILRRFRQADLEPFFEYRNDPRVAKYQSWDVPFELKKARLFVDEMEKQAFNLPGEWLQIAVELKQTGSMIGDLAYCILAEDVRQAKIGYSLSRRYWGVGYATESVQRLLRYFFDELKLHRVVAEADAGNVPSFRLLEKLGFRREAHLVENVWFKGAYSSDVQYAMLEREWDLLNG